MEIRRTGVAAVLAVVMAATAASVASAQTVPVNKCAAAKTKCVLAKVKGLLKCHQKAESKGLLLDPGCMQKVVTKFTACVPKAETKLPCLTLGDVVALEAAIDAFVLDVVQQLDPGYPAPVLNKCSAGKKKAVAAKAASKLGCLAKAFGKAPGTVDPSCLGKAETKFAAAFVKLEAKPPCLTTGDEAALEATVDAFYWAHVAALGGGGGPCGNGINDVGEACDASAPSTGWGACGADFVCTGCNCACPTRYEITTDATDPATVLDIGWMGFGHRQTLATNNTLTLGLSGCSSTNRPCGTCNVSGLVANGADKLDNRRCSNDTSIRCTSDAPCIGGGGTCEYYLGPWQGIAIGGVTLCIANQVSTSAGGTVNVETGESAIPGSIRMVINIGAIIDNPCPRCLGDASSNDGVAGGTCSGGTRNGLACDGNGTVPGYPDFGVSSLDCPPNSVVLGDLAIDLASATDPVTRTVTATNPTCTGTPGEKCLCDTCNNINEETCSADADCPDPAGPIGPLCGGRRCVGGVNQGTPCTLNSECPASQCNRAGEPTRPSGCLDDTATPGVFDCADTAPVDGEGECLVGPTATNCSIASGHPQRGCLVDADCGGGLGTCVTGNRRCFLTGSAAGFGLVGTQTLVAAGLEDTPVRDVAHPTLGSASCVGPGFASALNNVLGLPGPIRLVRKATATAHP